MQQCSQLPEGLSYFNHPNLIIDLRYGGSNNFL